MDSFLAHTTPFHQVFLKISQQFFCNPADEQVNKPSKQTENMTFLKQNKKLSLNYKKRKKEKETVSQSLVSVFVPLSHYSITWSLFVSGHFHP